MAVAEHQRLTAGRRVLVNSFWNVAGNFAPMVFALVAIPIVIRALGAAQFGILALAIGVIGSMAVFDLGLNHALTKFVADRLAGNRVEEIPGLFWGCLVLSLGLGLIAGAILFLFSPQLVHLLNIPPALVTMGCAVFRILALTVPILTITVGLQGFITAFQRFDLLIAVRVPSSAAVFLCPLAVLPFSHSLVVIVALLLLTRVLTGLAFLLICFRVFPGVRTQLRPQHRHFRSLLAFGGWVSVSNLVGAVMLYCDRFLISAILSVTAVTYYTTPYEAITKMTALPAAMSRAFFPALTEEFALSPGRAELLLKRGSNLILLALTPVILAAIILARFGLTLWLGPLFAQKSTMVLRWLAVGLLFNSVAYMPFTLLLAAHRPDLVAKLHAAELPFYLLAEFIMIKTCGIEGAAITWSARVLVDAIALWVLAGWVLPGSRVIAVRTALGVAAVLGLAAIGIWFPFSLTGQFIFLAAAMAIGLAAGWRFLLSGEDRRQINQWSAEFFPSKAG